MLRSLVGLGFMVGLAGPLRAQAPWLEGNWLFYPAHSITDSTAHRGEIRSDSVGTLYHLSPFLANQDGKWEGLVGSPRFEFNLHVANRADYWVSDSGGLTHYRNGKPRRFDSTNSCLKGDLFTLWGPDPQGKLLVERWSWFGMTGIPHGIVRFTDSTCEAVPLTIPPTSNLGLTGYFADPAGREYFPMNIRSDSPGGCEGMVRLDRGRVENLGPSHCMSDFAQAGGTLVATGLFGFYIFSDSGVPLKTPLGGSPVQGSLAVLVDSRQVLWVATEDERLFALRPGAAPWAGSDAIRFDASNAGFPDGAPRRLAEDAAGNIWVEFSGGQYSIFARDTAGLAVRPRFPVPRAAWRPWLPLRNAIDALGRNAPATPNSSATLPRRILFPAPSKP